MQSPLIKASSSVPTSASVTQRLQILSQSILAPPAAANTGTATTLEVLQDPVLQAVAAKDPALAARVASIAPQTKTALQETQANQTAYQQAIAKMLQDAMNLLKP